MFIFMTLAFLGNCEDILANNGGLSLFMSESRGNGGSILMHTKCLQGANTHFVCRFIENATIQWSPSYAATQGELRKWSDKRGGRW